jgi:hypothetical protein
MDILDLGSCEVIQILRAEAFLLVLEAHGKTEG